MEFISNQQEIGYCNNGFICLVNRVWHEANIDITGTPSHLIIVQDYPTLSVVSLLDYEWRWPYLGLGGIIEG